MSIKGGIILMTYILYGLCIVLTLVSFLKNKEKTKKAVINGVKSFEKIMPQFLSIVIVIAITLAILKPERFWNFGSLIIFYSWLYCYDANFCCIFNW